MMILLVLPGVVCAPQFCMAHALLMESTPGMNATVQGPDVDVLLRFNVRIEGSRSRVHLSARDGTVTTLTVAGQAGADRIQTRAIGLKPGSYKLLWTVLASDGHVSHGEIPFTVS